MFSATDYLKLQEIMDESPEKRDLLTRLLSEHQITISSISHEIRNPLTLVSSTIQLIENEHPEVHHFRYWSEMHQDIEYMTHLLNELSTYNNSQRLNISDIDTNSFFRTLTLSFATTIVDTKIQLISHISSDLPHIYGDAVKLKEAILNLLGNARDAVSQKSLNEDTYIPTIRLSISYDAGFLHITIKDNGCGISKENLPHIFEPFITHKSNGTGLGLAIVSNVIRSHQGTILVESLLDVHTTFTISLPVQKNG